MRFRNPTVAVLALAIPCTWYFARRDLVQSQTLAVAQSAVGEALEAEPAAEPEPAPIVLRPAPVASPVEHHPLQLSQDPTTLVLEAGKYAASAVVARWAEERDLAVSVDPQIKSISLELPQALTLNRTVLRALLDAHDVVLVVRSDVLHAVHRRNLAQKFGPPWDMTGDAPVDPDRLVTRTIPINYGAGNAVFATVRGLLTRDTNRIGNILYVQGAERIVLCDFARNVRYYERVIASLDVPGSLPPSAVVVPSND
jgi:hypothetical protein